MPSPDPPNPVTLFLRHTLATLAYRGGKVIADLPAEFASFSAGHGTRSAGEILAHIGDLLDWAWHQTGGEWTWRTSTPSDWSAERDRFFAAIARLDQRLMADRPLGMPAERIFQGAVADALTHVGQLALLRRLAGAPVRAENYARATIEAGRLGPGFDTPRVEFD